LGFGWRVGACNRHDKDLVARVAIVQFPNGKACPTICNRTGRYTMILDMNFPEAALLRHLIKCRVNELVEQLEKAIGEGFFLKGEEA
jgi:hypothetical protein